MLSHRVLEKEMVQEWVGSIVMRMQKNTHTFGLNICIHISIYIVKYKYTFYNIIMMSFRRKSKDFPFEENGAQFGVISGETKKNMSYIQTN